jgi:hypothetical protein
MVFGGLTRAEGSTCERHLAQKYTNIFKNKQQSARLVATEIIQEQQPS